MCRADFFCIRIFRPDGLSALASHAITTRFARGANPFRQPGPQAGTSCPKQGSCQHVCMFAREQNDKEAAKILQSHYNMPHFAASSSAKIYRQSTIMGHLQVVEQKSDLFYGAYENNRYVVPSACPVRGPDKFPCNRIAVLVHIPSYDSPDASFRQLLV